MNLERALELLNAIINHALVAEKLSDVIAKLLHIGFTRDELVTHFNFSASDVDEVENEMEWRMEE